MSLVYWRMTTYSSMSVQFADNSLRGISLNGRSVKPINLNFLRSYVQAVLLQIRYTGG